MKQLDHLRDENKISKGLEHNLMLGVIVAMLVASLQGCTADKPPPRGKPTWPTRLKTLSFLWKQGRRRTRCLFRKRSSVRARKCFLVLAPNAMVRMRGRH